jgi:hypothetical protein
MPRCAFCGRERDDARVFMEGVRLASRDQEVRLRRQLEMTGEGIRGMPRLCRECDPKIDWDDVGRPRR